MTRKRLKTVYCSSWLSFFGTSMPVYFELIVLVLLGENLVAFMVDWKTDKERRSLGFPSKAQLSQHFTMKLLKYLFKYVSVYFWRLPFSNNYQSVWSLDPKPPIICSSHKSTTRRYCSSALQRPIAGNEQNKTFGSGHFIPRTHTLQIKWVSTLQILCTEKS